MKKLLFSLLAIVFVGFICNASSSNLNKTKASFEELSKGKVKIKLEIGRQSKGCKGFGICGFAITYVAEVLGVELEAEILTVGTVNKVSSTMTEKNFQIIKQYFGTDSIIIEEDFRIDDKTAEILGFSDGYIIKKGNYKFTFDNKTKLYNVIF